MVSALSCSINGLDISISPTKGSVLATLHAGVDSLTEHTTCNYGLNPELDKIASIGGLRVSAFDELNEVRAIERADHPFFVATLYQPQLRSSQAAPHPIFVSLLRAAEARHRAQRGDKS